MASADNDRLITAPHDATPPVSSETRDLLVALEGHQRVTLNPVSCEPRRTAEIGKINHESGSNDIGVNLAQQLDRGLRRPAGGDQVVDQKDWSARTERIFMNLDDVDTVFELVVLANCLPGQLALLADRHEAAAEPISDRATENEAACLDAGDGLHPAIAEGAGELLDAGAKAVGMAEQRGDIAEHDAGLRIVRYRAHEALEINVRNQAHPGPPSLQEAAPRPRAREPIVERSG